jgi:hypothetical protein
MLNLHSLVNFQPQYRYLVLCDLLVASVHSVCEELKDTGLLVMPVLGSTSDDDRTEAFAKFKQGSILVSSKRILLYGIKWDTIPDVQDIIVLNFKATHDEITQARYRFRPTPATVIAITPMSHIDKFSSLLG